MSSNLRNEKKPRGLCYGSFGFNYQACNIMGGFLRGIRMFNTESKLLVGRQGLHQMMSLGFYNVNKMHS